MRLFSLLFLMLCLVSPLQAADKGADSDAIELIGKRLKTITGQLPDLVEPSPIDGVYLVAYGSDILYMSADGKYLITGDMRDLSTMRSVSEAALTRIRAPIMKELAKTDHIDFPATGESKYTITVFTDIDCGYCIKLHQGMKQMNDLGITVHYVAYPRAGLNSPSAQKWVNVWCSPDRQKAMTTAKAGGKLPKGDCDNPVAEHYRLAGKLGVRGTPAIFTEDGRQVGGYLPPKKLFAVLERK